VVKAQSNFPKTLNSAKEFVSQSLVISKWIIAFLLFSLAFLIFLPALENSFVWDDNSYVVKNAHIHSLDIKSLYWMATGFHAGNWHPLTWFSHALDCALWGLNPGKHLLTNLIFHGLNTALVFILIVTLLSRLELAWTNTSGNLIAGGVTSLLFGLHPLRVESVAWVAERKDLLCAFFFILSILSYTHYVFSSVNRRRRVWYGLSLILFAMALMSKPMAVTLPLVLLLLDCYPFRRFKSHSSGNLRILMEKVPFFILSVFSGILTLLAQHSGGAIKTLEQLAFTTRLLNALRVLMFYLEKIVLPIKLVPFYPVSVLSHWEYLFYGILVSAITGLSVWMAIKKKYLWLIVWSYYLITLLPVLGIIQVGGQLAADRYTYLPSLGPFLLVGIASACTWENASLSKLTRTWRGLVLISIFLVVVVCACLTRQQIKLWQNSESLWGRVNVVFPGVVQEAYFNLGVYYSEKGRVDEAIEHFKKAIGINPRYVRAHNNLGIAYTKKGFLEEAIYAYEMAIAINPRHERAHYNLGIVYFKQGDFDRAIVEFKNAIAINPSYAKAHYNLGNTYDKKGLWDKAITEYKKALALNPRYAEAYNNLAVIYCYRKKDFKLAVEYCKRAIGLGYKVHPVLLDALKSYL
jgi:Tfp pilus assembly protein PilF